MMDEATDTDLDPPFGGPDPVSGGPDPIYGGPDPADFGEPDPVSGGPDPANFDGPDPSSSGTISGFNLLDCDNVKPVNFNVCIS